MHKSVDTKPFLGLLYIVQELLKQDILHYDPNNRNNMLVYMSADDNNPEGWYSCNIVSTVSELYNSPKDMDYILNIATEHNIDINMHFENAKKLISDNLYY